MLSMFSSLKLIKSEKQCSLSEDHLDDLLRIAIDGPPLIEWDPEKAIQLWWKDKRRRSVHDHRKPPTKTQESESESDSSEQEAELITEEWEDFVTD